MIKQWSNSKGFFLFTLIFLMVLTIDVLFVYFYYKHVENFISCQPVEKPADAGIVFFGDYLDDNSDIGPDSKKRAGSAIQLFKRGIIRKIICVGGYSGRYWKGKQHLMRNYLLKNGVPEDAILHDSLSYNTITNWREARKIIKSKNFDTVFAISAPLHVFRISRMIKSDSVMYCSYKYNPRRTKDYWQLFKDVHHEWMSHILSFVLKDEIRNRSVYFYRTINREIKNVL